MIRPSIICLSANSVNICSSLGKRDTSDNGIKCSRIFDYTEMSKKTNKITILDFLRGRSFRAEKTSAMSHKLFTSTARETPPGACRSTTSGCGVHGWLIAQTAYTIISDGLRKTWYGNAQPSLLLTLVFHTTFALSAWAADKTVIVYVPTGPPAAVVETRPVSPGAGYVWIPGYHAWAGNAYVWKPGLWEVRPAGRHEWIPGHWKHNKHGWYWIDGHWR